jgi:hypothetical protein
MQSPPPFQGNEYRPQKPKKNGLLIVFAVLGVLGVCCGLPIGAGLIYLPKLISSAASIGSCVINTQVMDESLKMYVKENKDTLPKAGEWQTDLQKHFKLDESLKKDSGPLKLWTPSGVWSCKGDETETGFAFNDEFAGKKLSEIKDPSQAVLIYETKTVGFNQHGKYEQLPFDSAPKILGKKLGWMVITADFEVNFVTKDGKFKKTGGSASFNLGKEMAKADKESKQEDAKAPDANE